MKADAALDSLDLACTSAAGEGHPIVFVHGFSHNRHVWDRIVNGMPPSLRPHQLDLRGHGDSGWSPAGRYAPTDYVRDLPRLFDHLDLDRALLVGHSLGGLVSALFAAQYPARVDGLVLVDTGPDLSLAALDRIASDAGGAPTDFESVEAYADWLTGILPLADPDQLCAFARKAIVRRLDGRFELKVDPAAMVPDHDPDSWAEISTEIKSAFSQIRCPSLLVRGGRSALLSQDRAEDLAYRQLVRGELVTLENAGHAVMFEDGPALGQAIENFASKIATSHLGDPGEEECRPATGKPGSGFN